MDGVMCPYCQDLPRRSEVWARIEGETDTPTVQLLLDGETEPKRDRTEEELEFMTTLHPCGHSFPLDFLETVEEQTQILERLIKQHEESTDPFEIQLLRGDIHSTRQQLDAATERCNSEREVDCPHGPLK